VLQYILRRLMLLPLVIIGVTLLIFGMMQMLSPYQLLGLYVKSPEELRNQNLDALVEKYRLNDPIGTKYLNWVTNLAKGDLGYSESANMPVLNALLARFPATLELALFAVVPVVLGGIFLGSVSAVFHNRPLDSIIRIFAVVGWSLPDFVFGLFILMIFYGVLGWFPPGRLGTAAEMIVLSDGWRAFTGMHTIDALLNRNWTVFWDAIRHLIGPVMTLTYLWWAYILRITRSSMLDVMNKDYVRTALAKGVPETTVTRKHVLRNAMIPVTTVAGIMVIGLLGGVVIVETVFNYKGLGLLAATAAQQLDYPMVLGTTMFYAFLLVVVNLLVDLAYAFIDPRVRLE